MADQNRNQQPDPNPPPQGQPGRKDVDDETLEEREQRERTSREPASTAEDRCVGGERRKMSDTDELEEEGIESDLDTETDIEDEERS